MTKNERSLQWVIAGIFFVVCFAFFQWIYPNHLFFKEQIRGVKRNAINRVVRKNDNDFDN